MRLWSCRCGQESRLDCAYAVRRCLEAAQTLYLATGGRGVRDSNRIGRLQADLQAINMHAITALDPALEAYGRILMGHPPRTPPPLASLHGTNSAPRH